MTKTLDAVILDWAGTVVDFGSFAPTQIFVDAFKAAFNFDLSLAEARGPMGLGKWQHIEALGRDPAVAARWQSQFGKPMGKAEIQHIYDTFIPLQVERVGLHSALIPGSLETLAALRARGLALSGSPAGWTQAEYLASSTKDRAQVRDRVTAEFKAAGAHHVIDTIADLPGVVERIEAQVAAGERP